MLLRGNKPNQHGCKKTWPEQIFAPFDGPYLAVFVQLQTQLPHHIGFATSRGTSSDTRSLESYRPVAWWAVN